MSNGDILNKGRIYSRDGTITKEASYEEIQEMINLRIQTEYSSTSELELDGHLAQLRGLSNKIDRYKRQ